MIANQTKPPLDIDCFVYWLENETFWELFAIKPKQWIQLPSRQLNLHENWTADAGIH